MPNYWNLYISYSLYIDGAHTMESVQQCVHWFHDQTASNLGKKCLLFNVTGNRNASQLLQYIYDTVTFDLALFSPNVARLQRIETDGQNDYEVQKLEDFAEFWRSLKPSGVGSGKPATALVFGTVEQVLQHLQTAYGSDEYPVDVLVTGSLYMVGAIFELTEHKAFV